MRKLMWFTIGYALSCAFGTWLARGSGLLLAELACLAALAAAWRFREHPAVKRGMVLALGCAFGCLAFFGYAFFVLGPAAAMDGVETEVTIRVTDYSWQTEYGIAADGELELSGRRYKVRFYVNEDRQLEPGDVVQMRARLRLTDEGGEQEPTFHRTSGILLLVYPRGTPTVEEGEPSWRDLPALWARRLKEILSEAFPADAAAFAKALLLGDQWRPIIYQDAPSYGMRNMILSTLYVSALAVAFALYMFLWEMRLPTEIDLQIHASYSVDFDFTDLHSITSRIAYPLWHVLVAILYQLGLPIDWSAAIVTTLFRTVTFVFTYRLLNRMSGNRLKTFWLALCTLLVFVVRAKIK